MTGSEITAVPLETEPNAEVRPKFHRKDGLLILILIVAAFGFRFPGTKGDIWLDESDYAFAALRGFEINRWDKATEPLDPLKLIRYRHYHPPGIAYMIELALPFSHRERAVRTPSMLTGLGSIALMYLCSLSLFKGRRKIAFLLTLMLVITPADIRASCHAISWSYIVFWILTLLFTMLKYAETKRPGWIVGGWAALAGMYVISEFFFPMLLIWGLCAPFLFAADLRDSLRRKSVWGANGLGLLVFLGLAWIFWPAGLTGGAWKMLSHYLVMRNTEFPVVLFGKTYAHAPKWAYLYWYTRFYPVYTFIYLSGLAALAAFALRRRLTPESGILLVFNGVVLFAAHKAHIIGPSYLVHALPLMTLAAGYVLIWVERGRRGIGFGVWGLALVLNFISLHIIRGRSMDMEPRMQTVRWPYATAFLAAQWKDLDRMLAPSYASPARWYMVHEPRVKVQEWQVQALPDSNAGAKLLKEIATGNYRFIGVGSTFDDHPAIDPRIRKMIETWPVIWQSDEEGKGVSRLKIYRCPDGATNRTPLPIPPR